MKFTIIFCVLFFILFIHDVNAAITEIMYNPPGNDNNKEYVELVFNVNISLQGWTVEDSSHQDVLALINGSGNTKINLIVEEGYTGEYFASLDLTKASVYSAGAAIGNGLGNEGDSVYLYDGEGNLTENVAYNNSYANGDGNALCISGTGEKYSCKPSPGKENENTIPPDENKTDYPIANVSGYSKPIKPSESYIRIRYIENPPLRGCKYLTVYTEISNAKKSEQEVRAYVQGVNVFTKLNVKAGQELEIGLPVATCNNSISLERGDYIVVVEGFEEDDMQLVYLTGFAYQCKEQKVSLRNSVTESNINDVSVSTKQIKRSTSAITNDKSGLQDAWFYLLYAVGGLSVYYLLFKV